MRADGTSALAWHRRDRGPSHDREPEWITQLALVRATADIVQERVDEAAGRPGSERILLELEDANAFVESLDPERTWVNTHVRTIFAKLQVGDRSSAVQRARELRFLAARLTR